MVQEWNMAIQRELPKNMALEVGYIGNHQMHSLYQPNQNACPTVITANPAITCTSLRRYPDIGSLSGTASFGFGNYNGLTTSLTKRYSAGLQLQASYTYGHALADTGTTLSGSPGFFNYDNTNI